MPTTAPVLSADLDLRLVGGDGLDVAEENESDCKVAVILDIVAIVDANVGSVSRSLFDDLGTRNWDRRP